jgi:uracil-DNA glycosylase
MTMARAFDRGPTTDRFLDLLETYPDESAYPWKDFRVEWGPIFYRGRLDGTARILVIGQDPAEQECIARRPLVGTAGRRVQGFLAKLGMTRSYVIINAFLYGVYGGLTALRKRDAPGIREDRDAWLEAIFARRKPDAVVAFGGAAEAMFRGWEGRNGSAGVPFRRVLHPTWPNSSGQPLGPATEKLLAEWNSALTLLFPEIGQRDVDVPLLPYGSKFEPEDLPPIPREDLPAGIPSWMQGPRSWADRVAEGTTPKRARIAVTVPTEARGWE